MMRSTRSVLPLAALLAAALAPAVAGAESTGSGYFRMGDNKQEYKHAVALARDSTTEAGKREVNVYLTTHPVDPAKAVDGFDLDTGITDQLREVNGGMTRISINAEGGDAGLWFWVSEPSDTFNTSGYGKLTLTTNSSHRIEGSHVLAEPNEFFDKTYQFDLKFAADVTDANFRGDALPAGGGDAGKAYIAYMTAVNKGDADTLRPLLGDAAEWMLPKDDPESSKSYIETLQYGVPKTATVTGGWLQGERAILKVDATDRDGNKQRGVVLMTKSGETWSKDSEELTTLW
jgi:hypothetical protein